jgi:sensor domain CHASE-containing protein
LSGPYEGATPTAASARSIAASDDRVAIEPTLAALRADVDALKTTVVALCAKVGVEPPSFDR